MKKVLIVFLAFFVFFPYLVKAETNHLLIISVQIEGETSKEDFIKIYNPLAKELDVSGFKLRKRSSTGKEYSIRVFPKGTSIPPFGILLWANSQNNFAQKMKAYLKSSATISKNNSVALFDNKGNLIDALCWGEPKNPFREGFCFPENPGKNQVLERKKNGKDYQDTDNNSEDFFLSPPPSSQQEEEKENTKNEKIFPTSSHSPVAIAGPNIITQAGKEVVFDGSQSSDPDKDHLFFFWNFGDGTTSQEISPHHSFLFPGKYPVTLQVSDGKNKDTDQIIVDVLPTNLYINEISLREGWIELLNNNNYPIEISGWKIKNGSKIFSFPNNSFLLPKQYIVIKNNLLGFDLKNSSSLSLLSPQNIPLQEITYSRTDSSSVIARTKEGIFSQTSTPTPASPNIFSLKRILVFPQKEKFPSGKSSSKKDKIILSKKNEKFSPKNNSPQIKEPPLKVEKESLSATFPILKSLFPLIFSTVVSLFFVFVILIIKRKK